MDRYVNPTTAWEQGAVVVNSQRDDEEIVGRRHAGSTPGASMHLNFPFGSGAGAHDDVFSVYSGEPVLLYKDQDNGGTIRDADYIGFTSLNGINHSQATSTGKALNDANKAREAIRESLVCVGLARNDAPFDTRDSTRNNNMFTTLIGGVKTTVNTGPDDISPGDIVVWDLPELEESTRGVTYKKRAPIEGVEDEKVLPVLRPLYGPVQPSIDAILKAWKDPADKPGTIAEKVGKALADVPDMETDDNKRAILVSLMNAYHDVSSRVVGKAIVGARPGEHFDISLGSYCV